MEKNLSEIPVYFLGWIEIPDTWAITYKIHNFYKFYKSEWYVDGRNPANHLGLKIKHLKMMWLIFIL